MTKAGQVNDRLKENLKEALTRKDSGLSTINLDEIIDMDSAADKMLKIIDKIIYGEKVGTAHVLHTLKNVLWPVYVRIFQLCFIDVL